MKSKNLSNLLVGQARKAGNGSKEPGIPEEPVKKAASLLDDTLSDKRRKTNWKTPIWISGVVIAASLLTVYFIGADQPGEASIAGRDDAARNAELLEKLVVEAKTAETDNTAGGGMQAEPIREETSTEASGNLAANNTLLKDRDVALRESRPGPAAGKPAQAEAVPAPKQEDSSHPEAEASPRPENFPQLIRDVPREEAAETAAAPVEDPLPQDNRKQEAFSYLENNSPVAGKLINGGYGNLAYSGWKVIRETDQEIWIDIEAAWSSGGPSIHHIWSVDIPNKQVKALSQAARNLEALKD